MQESTDNVIFFSIVYRLFLKADLLILWPKTKCQRSDLWRCKMFFFFNLDNRILKFLMSILSKFEVIYDIDTKVTWSNM